MRGLYSSANRVGSDRRRWRVVLNSWTQARWQQATSSVSALSLKLIGPLLTAAAAALGAPFWFVALNRIGSLRNVGRKPSESS